MNEDSQLALPTPSITKLTENEKKFREILSQYNNFIIFSPHLDDAILSTGSLLTYLAEQGKNVHVINVFTEGSTLESSLSERFLKQANNSNPAKYFTTRRSEDKTALERIGSISITNLGLTDAAWRGRNNKAFYETIFDLPNSADSISMDLEKSIKGINVRDSILRSESTRLNSSHMS